MEVRMTYTLRQVMNKPETTRRMLKRAIELGQFNLENKPGVVIKG